MIELYLNTKIMGGSNIDKNNLKEFIVFSKNKTRIGLFVFSGKDKETGSFISVVPSLQISGYGSTLEEADEMLNTSVNEYIRELTKLSSKEKHNELIRSGWRKAPHKNKEFRPYIDADGVLRDFDFEGKIEKRNIEEELVAA